MVEERQIQTRMGPLHVEVRGSGTAVVCWPSLYGDARTLDPIAEELGRDHRVVVIDGPGHGKSPPPAKPPTFVECADAAIEVLTVLGIDRAAWFGPAWGGHVGVVAALRSPARVSGLVILNAPMSVWRGKNRMLMRLSYVLIRMFGPRSFVAPMIAAKMIGRTARDRETLVRILTDAMHRCDRRGLVLAVKNALQREDLVPSLPAVRVPTLFFTGAEDTLFPVEAARAQAAAIPGARFVVVEHSSHQSALEATTQVLSLVRPALAEWHRDSSAATL